MPQRTIQPHNPETQFARVSGAEEFVDGSIDFSEIGGKYPIEEKLAGRDELFFRDAVQAKHFVGP